jgi:hypothetical protein
MNRAVGYGAQVNAGEEVYLFLREVVQLAAGTDAATAVAPGFVAANNGVVEAEAVFVNTLAVRNPRFHLYKGGGGEQLAFEQGVQKFYCVFRGGHDAVFANSLMKAVLLSEDCKVLIEDKNAVTLLSCHFFKDSHLYKVVNKLIG